MLASCFEFVTYAPLDAVNGLSWVFDNIHNYLGNRPDNDLYAYKVCKEFCCWVLVLCVEMRRSLQWLYSEWGSLSLHQNSCKLSHCLEQHAFMMNYTHSTCTAVYAKAINPCLQTQRSTVFWYCAAIGHYRGLHCRFHTSLPVEITLTLCTCRIPGRFATWMFWLNQEILEIKSPSPLHEPPQCLISVTKLLRWP